MLAATDTGGKKTLFPEGECLRASVAMKELQNQIKLGRKGFAIVHFRQESVNDDVSAGVLRQALKRKPWTAAYWLAPCGFLSMSSDKVKPGVAPPTVSWALLHQLLILIKEIPYRFAHKSVWWWHFLS